MAKKHPYYKQYISDETPEEAKNRKDKYDAKTRKMANRNGGYVHYD